VLNSGDNFIFFDNRAGAQVPQVELDAVQNHLLMRHVQRGGRYGRSEEVNAVIPRATSILNPMTSASLRLIVHSARKTLSRKTKDSFKESTRIGVRKWIGAMTESNLSKKFYLEVHVCERAVATLIDWSCCPTTRPCPRSRTLNTRRAWCVESKNWSCMLDRLRHRRDVKSFGSVGPKLYF